MNAPGAPVPLAPKFVIIDDFLPDDFITGLEDHLRVNGEALQLQELGGSPTDGYYSAGRKLWVHEGALGRFEPAFSGAITRRFDELCMVTGVLPFEIARIETQVCAQRPGSFFSKHIDTDIGDVRGSMTTDRLISSVYYFPREPLAFTGGELVLYDFTGKVPSARIAPRRNRLVAFPSFACHEVSPVESESDRPDDARWSVNCWLHRARAGVN